MEKEETVIRKHKKSTIISETTKKPKAAVEKNYVDNEEFLKQLIIRKQHINENKKIPFKTSEYIGDCILKIAKNLSKKYQFANYPFKSEFVSDAILVCIKYMDNYDPNITKNPFSYFSQICYYAFIARINLEKTETYVKFKSTINSAIMSDMAINNVDEETSTHILDNMEFTEDFMDRFINDYEEKIKNKKQKTKKKTGLEEFLDD